MLPTIEYMRLFHRLVYIAALITAIAAFPLNAQWKRVTNDEQLRIPQGFENNYWLEVYFLPDDPRFGWICGFNGLVVRTVNGGETWQGASIPGADQLESIIFVNPRIGFTSGPGQMYKSIDGGATWFDIQPEGSGQNLWGHYFINENIGMLVGGGCTNDRQNFWRTTNGGTDWTLMQRSVIGSGMTDVILFEPQGIGYASSSGRIWNTTDGGVSWFILFDTGSRVWQEEIGTNGRSFLVPYSGPACNGGRQEGGMRMRTDFTDTWIDWPTGEPMFGAYLLNDSVGWACGYAGAVYETTDHGITWNLRNCGIEPTDTLDDIWFINDTTAWVVGTAIFEWIDVDLDFPSIRVDEPIDACEGDTVLLTAVGDHEFYRWSTGEVGQTIAVVRSGEYTVNGFNDLGCSLRSKPASVSFFEQPRPEISANAPVAFCEGGEVRLSAPEGFAAYRWSNGSTSRTITVDQSGAYTVNVTNENGCEGPSQIIEVTVHPTPQPQIAASGPTSICLGDLVTLTASDGYVSYRWSNGLETQSIVVDRPGTFSVEVVDENGCVGESEPLVIELRVDRTVINVSSVLSPDGVQNIRNTLSGEMTCVELGLINESEETVVVSNSFFLRNIEFTVPRSQLPLVFPPGETVNVTACYAPSAGRVQNDTLVIPEQCVAVPFSSAGQAQTYGGHTRCGIDVRGQTDDFSQFVFAASEPFPNPSSDEIVIEAHQFLPEGFVAAQGQATLFNAFGTKIAETPYTTLAVHSYGTGSIEEGHFAFDVSEYPAGAYFIVLTMPGSITTYQTLIQR